jgi:hypothetical protein
MHLAYAILIGIFRLGVGLRRTQGIGDIAPELSVRLRNSAPALANRSESKYRI